MRRGEPPIMTLPLPEVREMVEAAARYVAGEIHFSYLVGPTERCVVVAGVRSASRDPETRQGLAALGGSGLERMGSTPREAPGI